jgi:hypothetical protein
VQETDLQENYTYTPPNAITIPEGLTKYLVKSAEIARWVRYKIRNEEDSTNVANAIFEGYRFVSQEDLEKASVNYFFDITKSGKYNNDMLTRGDLVLMKIKLAKLKARAEYYAQIAKNAEMAVRQEMKSKIPGVQDNSEYSYSVPQVRVDN